MSKVDELFEQVLSSLSPPNEQDKFKGLMSDDFSFDDRRVIDDGSVSEIDISPSNNTPTSLSSEEHEAAEASVREYGFEILAFYKSRRHLNKRPYSGKWGIFYLDKGIQFVAEKIKQEYIGHEDPWKLSYLFLRAHEHFHYRADLQTLMFEATLKHHLYIPLHNYLRGRQTSFVEESLANRQVLDWSRKRRYNLGNFAYDFMKLQPDAYARFDEDRIQLASEWAANTLDLNFNHGFFRKDIARWVEAKPFRLLDKYLCPEYLVSPTSIDSWWPANKVPPIIRIDEDDNFIKLLNKRKDQSLKEKWQRTKIRLLKDRFGNGLNFKPWPPESAWSVKVDEGNRAHLRDQGQGHWLAYKIGPHDFMGH